MTEELVSLKTFNLALNVGFKNYVCILDRWLNISSRPPQSLLQKWFREVHNIILWVIPVNYNDRFMVKGVIRHGKLNHELIVNDWADTYEEALEFGLIEACKKLAKKP